MKIIVFANSCLAWKGKIYPCIIGENGLIEAKNKQEGDFVTPIGCWRIEEILYRKDRLGELNSNLPISSIKTMDGWCDDSNHKNYNKKIQFPFSASAEKLWREDPLYDIIFVLGYNRNPIFSGKGSAIFLHIANRKAQTDSIYFKQKTKKGFFSKQGISEIKETKINPVLHSDPILDQEERMDINQVSSLPKDKTYLPLYKSMVLNDWKPTKGCVAISKRLALDMVNHLSTESYVEILNVSSNAYY